MGIVNLKMAWPACHQTIREDHKTLSLSQVLGGWVFHAGDDTAIVGGLSKYLRGWQGTVPKQVLILAVGPVASELLKAGAERGPYVGVAEVQDICDDTVDGKDCPRISAQRKGGGVSIGVQPSLREEPLPHRKPNRCCRRLLSA